MPILAPARAGEGLGNHWTDKLRSLHGAGHVLCSRKKVNSSLQIALTIHLSSEQLRLPACRYPGKWQVGGTYWLFQSLRSQQCFICPSFHAVTHFLLWTNQCPSPSSLLSTKLDSSHCSGCLTVCFIQPQGMKGAWLLLLWETLEKVS